MLRRSIWVRKAQTISRVHFAVAARIYATPHIFFRPAVDVHWVNNFFQFGSNWVPEYTMGLGYSFGGE